MTSGNDLFSLEQIEVEKTSVDTTIIFEEIHKVIREHLSKEIDTDSTDGVFDLLKNSTNCLQEDFNWRRQQQEKVLPRHWHKFSRCFLNTKVDTADKIKRILKIAIETTLKIWQGPNQLHVE